MHITQYFFDHRPFQHEAHFFVSAADKGDYSPILGMAQEIRSSLSPDEWILCGQGTDLLDLDRLLPPAQVGFAFLLLLSQYLTPLTFHREGKGVEPLVGAAPRLYFAAIARAAEYLGWSKADLTLLDQGMATTALLKPDLVPDPFQRPPVTDEYASQWRDPAYYWWWVRPLNAYHTGWWSSEQVASLCQRILEQRDSFEKVPVHELSVSTSVDEAIYRNQLAVTLRVLEQATRTGLGLFRNDSELHECHGTE